MCNLYNCVFYYNIHKNISSFTWLTHYAIPCHHESASIDVHNFILNNLIITFYYHSRTSCEYSHINNCSDLHVSVVFLLPVFIDY